MMLMLMTSYMLMMFSLINFMFWMNSIMFNKIIIMEWMILNMNSFKFNLMLMIDNYSLIFMMMVSFISSMVMIYSMEYMNMNKLLMNRFSYLIILFILSMFLMILSPNILSIMLGWDGLGLISYCLVIFYQNYKALNAGTLTIILNRLGDISLLMLIALSMMNNSFNQLLYSMNNLMLILLIIMSMTKSAQIPFSSWLPAAMMAPTPISALVHSSTLVTAGVYLMIRYNNLLSINSMKYLLLISSLTMFMAGLTANFECDFKKIIALSTLSQLGFMFSIICFKMYELAFLHLLIHAMFKSLMFLCAGSFIHYMNNSQDYRDYNGMFYLYPFKSLIFMFSSMCLCGFPFLAAFFSKDMIMEYMFFNQINFLSIFNLMMGTIFSMSYSTRLMMMMMFNFYPKFFMLKIKENSLMNMCMMIMMIMTIFFSKMYINLIFLSFNINLNSIMKFMIIKLCLIGMIMGYQFFKYLYIKNLNKMLFLKNMFFMNTFYKINYMKFLKNTMNYEMYFDKLILNSFNLNLINYFNNFTSINLNKFTFYKFMNLSIMMIYLMMLFF